VRLFIVEDHPIYREGLLATLNRSPGIEVVAAVGTVAEARAALTTPIDVALVDLGLPDGSGLDVVRLFRDVGVHVLVLTMSHDPAHVIEAVRAGAHGYVVKGSTGRDISAALASVAEGNVLFGVDVADVALKAVSDRSPQNAAFPMLSPREREVLDLLALGLPNRTIAQRLGVSDKTVRNHVSNILTKLGVADRHAAAERSRDAGS